MRTSFLLLAAAVAVVGCGDDTGGTGGSGTGSGNGTGSATGAGGDASTTTTGSSSPASTGSGEGGGTTGSTSGNGGGGGSTTSGGAGGFEPADTVQEACENLNAVFAAAAAELGCTSAPGDCDAPVDACEPELLAFMNCLVENVDAVDCECTGGGEGGGGGAEPVLSCEGVASGECPDENAAYAECMGF